MKTSIDQVDTESTGGWVVVLRPSRYLRSYDVRTERVELITSRPNDAMLFDTESAAKIIADANEDEADNENGFPMVVYASITTTLIYNKE